MTSLKLSRGQRRRLQRQLKATQDARVYQRTLAILEYSQGQPLSQIASLLRVSRQSVSNWIAAYRQTPVPTVLHDQERPGRPSLWTEGLRALLRSLLGRAPDERGYVAVNWTVALLQEERERCSGQRLSDDTLRRELDRLGYVWKRSRYVLDPDPQREKKTTASLVDSPPAGFVAAQRVPG